MAVNKAVIDIVLNTKDAQRALKSFMTQMRGLNVIGKELHSIFKGAGIIGAAIAVGKMAINASNFAKQMEVAARKIGLASSELVSMKASFDAIGADGKNIEKVFGKIHQGMQSFKYGDGKWVSQLASFGINAFGASGRQKSDQQILYDVMDAAQRMRQQGRSEQDVADMLQRLVGADYQIAQKMMMGSVAFRAWNKQSEQERGVVNQRQLNNLSRLNESFHLLGQTLDTFKKQVFGDLAPAVQFFTDVMQYAARAIQPVWEGIMEFVHAMFGDQEDWKEAKENIKVAVIGIGEALGWLFKAMKPLAEGLGFAFKTIVRILYWIGEALGEALWKIMHPIEALKQTWNDMKNGGKEIARRHEIAWAYASGEITWEDSELVKDGKMTLEEAKERGRVPKEISDAEADANLAKAIQSGSVVIQNDIGVEVNTNENGATEVTITSNGKSSTGTESSTTMTERTMS